MDRWIWVCLVPLLIGCTSTHLLPVEDRMRIYEQDFDTVYDAVIITLEREGYPLHALDYMGGTIETDFKVDEIGSGLEQVSASVFEGENGVHLLLTYYREARFVESENYIPDCYYERQVKRDKRHFQDPCRPRVIDHEIIISPTFTKSFAQSFYTQLFARIEQTF